MADEVRERLRGCDAGFEAHVAGGAVPSVEGEEGCLVS